MNQGQGANSWLMVGGMVSLLVHLIAGLGVIGATLSEPGSGDGLTRPVLPEGEDPPKPVLGVQDSTSVSINWLGFADPTEHRGELSQTEQPALSTAPMGEPSEQGATTSSEIQTNSQAQTSPSERAPLDPISGEGVTATPPSPSEPLEPAPSLALTPQESEAIVQVGVGALRLTPSGLPPAPEQVPVPPAGGSETDNDAQDPGQGERQTPESGALSGADDIPGMPSDRESIATALREAVTLTQWGKPLARKGLEIKTVRPRWRTTTLLTRLPRNPVVMVSFAPDGRVAHAEFVLYKGRRLNSGSKDVDEPMLDAVYKWRATGEELKRLGKDERVTFAIRVVLRR